MRMHPSLACLALSLAAVWATPAAAQPRPPLAGVERPWLRNVPRKNQESAERLLHEGNALTRKSSFAEAEKKYREALAQWDHPGAHYNLALALLKLDRPIEVHKHMTQALRHGEAALSPEKYAHARFYKDLLEKQLAWVEISCETADAVVTVGGERLPLVDGRYEGLMRPGPATLVATREGFQLRKKELSLSPGQTNNIRFRLYTEEELIRYSPRWAPWKPWAVVGAGAALAAGGGWLYARQREDFRAFDRHVGDCANGTTDLSCREQGLISQRQRLERLGRVSVGTVATGGAVLATGAVLVLLNRSEPYRIDPDQYEREQVVAVTPLLGRDTAGALASFKF